MIHARWERTEEDREFFRDEGRLVALFWGLSAGGAGLLVVLGAGLWRLRVFALRPPVFVGVAGGQVFTGHPQPAGALTDADFDAQCADTVQVLFCRNERGAVPALADYCAPEVLAAVNRDYADAAAHYPAGFVQTLTLLEAKQDSAANGLRRWRYRGLLSSRSQDAAQISPIYLDCTFARAGRTSANPAGWRLVRLKALARDDFYREEEESARRQALGLTP
ncbi:MAG TPA: hypothetical protein VGL42_08160 [Opitutaceae bacterium]|jgi:hypothetical protein